MEKLIEYQQSYEIRFGCCICFGAKLCMISGKCQHRICDECLYIDDERRPCMKNCPTCGLANSFPQKRPTVPQEVIDIQKCLGVQLCPNGCSASLWFWEVDEHLLCCPKSCKRPKTQITPTSTHRVQRRRVSDLGPVNTTRRITRQSKTYALRRRKDTP